MSDSLGCVKWFSNKKGFGFVTNLDSNEDIFVHFSEINVSENTYKTLIDGEYISYTEEVLQDGKKTAKNIRGVRGGNLLCQHPTKKILLVNKVSRDEREN